MPGWISPAFFCTVSFFLLSYSDPGDFSLFFSSLRVSANLLIIENPARTKGQTSRNILANHVFNTFSASTFVE